MKAIFDRTHSSDQKARITHCKPFDSATSTNGQGNRITSDPDIHIARQYLAHGDLAHGDADGADCKPFVSVVNEQMIDVVSRSQRVSLPVPDDSCSLRGDDGLLDPRPLIEPLGPVHKKRATAAERRASKREVKPTPKVRVQELCRDEIDARRGYEMFYNLPIGSSTLDQVRATSAGVVGWSNFARSPVNTNVDQRQAQQRALLKNICIIDEVVAQRKLVDGGSASQRPGIHLFEVVDLIVDQAVFSAENWVDIEFEVALDSGSQDHVCDEQDCPGYVTEVSPGSSRGQCFIVGDGGKLPNQGQRQLNMQPMGDATVDMRSCFQIARVTRPLMSVGKMCDNGLTVTFDDKQAVVKDKDGLAVCTFERAPGGLYLGKFRLKNPSPGFAGRG